MKREKLRSAVGRAFNVVICMSCAACTIPSVQPWGCWLSLTHGLPAEIKPSKPDQDNTCAGKRLGALGAGCAISVGFGVPGSTYLSPSQRTSLLNLTPHLKAIKTRAKKSTLRNILAITVELLIPPAASTCLQMFREKLSRMSELAKTCRVRAWRSVTKVFHTQHLVVAQPIWITYNPPCGNVYPRDLHLF
eukprot:jgi/Botrbrau1/18409/Bobra.0072s0002.1